MFISTINILQDLEVQTIKLQILTNVVAYCVSAMGNSSVIHAVFSPELGKCHATSINRVILHR